MNRWQDRLEKLFEKLPIELHNKCLKGYMEETEDGSPYFAAFSLTKTSRGEEALGAFIDNMGDMMKSDAIHALIDIMEEITKQPIDERIREEVRIKLNKIKKISDHPIHTLNLTSEEFNAVEVAIDHLAEHLKDSLADTFEDDLKLQPKLDATLSVRKKLRHQK